MTTRKTYVKPGQSVLFFTTKAKCHIVHEAIRAMWIERGLRIVPRWEDCSQYAKGGLTRLVVALEKLASTQSLSGEDAYRLDIALDHDWPFRESWQYDPPVGAALSYDRLGKQWKQQYRLIANTVEALT